MSKLGRAWLAAGNTDKARETWEALAAQQDEPVARRGGAAPAGRAPGDESEVGSRKDRPVQASNTEGASELAGSFFFASLGSSDGKARVISHKVERPIWQPAYENDLLRMLRIRNENGGRSMGLRSRSREARIERP